ncbi:alpha/beta fold hydrolase [Gymnodinialimonas sp. 2305UL16-5]|uniref:alpha/beta hydrolase n=1 Tax=Gymnodinialimonas mytili TaxID=3126503 RepID=UPI00309C095D
MRVLLIGAAGVAALYLVIVAGFVLLQRNLMYLPSNANPPPETLGLSGVSVHDLPTPDGERVVLWYAPAAPGHPTILFLHGNGGEVASRADRFAAYRDLGFGVAFLSWRGYGGSSGRPTERGLLTDARTAYDWVIGAGVAPEDLAVIGESLGTGIAVQLAADVPVGAVVLGAPYSAAVDVAADLYPFLPVRLLMFDQFRSIDHIRAITAPILIQHGTEDRIIPYHSGRALYAAAGDNATFVTLDGMGHEALYIQSTWETEAAFLRDVLSP